MTAHQAPPSFSSVWIFLALVFPISWLLWVPVMLDKTNPVFLNLTGGPALVAMWLAGSRNGRAWNLRRLLVFLAVIPLCWMIVILNVALNSNPPAPLQFNPGLLLPSAISPWIVSGAFSDNTGLRVLLRGRLPSRDSNGADLAQPPGWRWPTIALLIIPVFLLSTAALGRAIGLPVTNPASGLTTSQLAGLAAIRFLHYLMFTAVFEEPGWRGFLLPRLQRTATGVGPDAHRRINSPPRRAALCAVSEELRFSPLMASVLVWMPWAIWHLPLDLTRPGGWSLQTEFRQRVVALLIFSVVITWLYNRSPNGLLSATIFHGATGSFLYVLPYSAPIIVPLGVVLVAYAIISGRMWRQQLLGQGNCSAPAATPA